MSSTFQFSKLSTEIQAKVNEYKNSPFVTFVKPVLEGFTRFAIGRFDEIDSMLTSGWLVVDNTESSPVQK